MKSLMIIAAMAFTSPALLATPPENEPYHIMYTMNGKDKCMNKGSKEKADQCAEKMRAKGKATNVQVMAGKCKSM